MKLETLPFREVLDRTEEVFEAVIVVGQRAKQINSRRAAEQVINEEELPEDEFAVPSGPYEDYEEQDKSNTLAMTDFLSDQLKWRYAPLETEEDGEKPGAKPEF